MCGIAGIVKKSEITEDDIFITKKMTDKLSHRGPDDEGIKKGKNFVFGHKRLSIIDLKFGKQPMQTEDKKATITYNGEVYNYVEIRQELTKKGVDFSTFSDTEVILKKVVTDGLLSFLETAIGMFAFALFNEREKKLICAVDNFGIKPFYYYFDEKEKTFVFASEIKAILEYLKEKRKKPEINYDALFDYFTFQFCLGEKTFFKDIKKLKPATYLVWNIDDEKPKTKKYWDISFEVDNYHTEEYFSDKLLALIRDSVRLHLRSDVPLGAHLSGGIDSSVVSLFSAESYPGEFLLFHGRFPEYPEYDEYEYAKEIANSTKNTKLIEIKPSPDDFVDNMPKIIYFMDEPSAGPGVFPQFMVNKTIREYVKVVLGGQGGDELFGGYARYLIAYLEQCIKHAIFETNEEGKYVVTLQSIIRSLPHLKNYIPTIKYFWKEGLFGDMDERYFRLVDRSEEIVKSLSSNIKEEYLKNKKGRIYPEFQKIFNKEDTRSLFNKMTYFDMKTLLPALLHVEDRVSMAFSVESRVPLLNREIAELSGRCPPTIKFKNGEPKYLLRKAVENILPQKIVSRKDKMGFPVPLNEWIQESRKVRDFVFGTILESNFTGEIFNLQEVEKILSSPKPFSRSVWGIMCLSLWHDTFIKT